LFSLPLSRLGKTGGREKGREGRLNCERRLHKDHMFKGGGGRNSGGKKEGKRKAAGGHVSLANTSKKETPKRGGKRATPGEKKKKKEKGKQWKSIASSLSDQRVWKRGRKKGGKRRRGGSNNHSGGEGKEDPDGEDRNQRTFHRFLIEVTGRREGGGGDPEREGRKSLQARGKKGTDEKKEGITCSCLYNLFEIRTRKERESKKRGGSRNTLFNRMKRGEKKKGSWEKRGGGEIRKDSPRSFVHERKGEAVSFPTQTGKNVKKEKA